MFKKVFIFLILLLAPPATYANSIIDDPTGAPVITAQAVTDLVIRLQNIVFAAAGGIAVVMIVWGAIVLITAGGNEERTAKGKKILTWAIGGIIFIVSATAIISMYIRLLGGGVS